MAFSYRENYIKFGFDPYEFIREGIDLALKNNLGIYMSEDRVINPNSQPNTSKARSKPYNWSGYNPSSSLSVTQQLDINMLGSFIDQDLINEFEDVFSEINAKLDLGKDSKPARIKFTDKPIGIFSFSQASKGLIRPVEFYSFKENKLIKPENVFSKKENDKEYFYYFLEDEEYEVQRRQEGTTEMIKNCPFLKVEYDFATKLYLPYDDGKVVNECKGYRLRFTSTNKKVYAFREKKGGGVAPYVDLYIPVGGNWTFDPEQMLIRAVPSIVLGRILEKSGVRVRIFAVYSQEQVSGGTKFINLIFKVKDYGETTDVNRLAVFSADPRFFRYHLFNAQIGHNFSLTGLDDMTPNKSGANYRNFSNLIMPAIRNVVDYKIKIGEFPSQVVNKKLMLYGGVDSNTQEELSNQNIEKRIIESFYFNMDYIQLNLTKAPRLIMQEIIKRLKSQNKSDFDIKNYLQNLITGVYSTTSEIQSKTPKQLKEELDNGIINENEYKNQLRVQIQLDTKEEQDEVREYRNKNLAILNELMP